MMAIDIPMQANLGKTPRFVLVNGILTHGEGTVDRLGDELEDRGYVVSDPRFRRVNPFSARWRGPRIAQQLAERWQEGDVLIAHSFGCVIAGHMMRMAPYAGALLVAPAMSKDWDFELVDRRYMRPYPMIYCLHSCNDRWVRRGSMMLLHPFGQAGREGFTDARVRNITTTCRHSEYFDGWRLKRLADDVTDYFVPPYQHQPTST